MLQDTEAGLLTHLILIELTEHVIWMTAKLVLEKYPNYPAEKLIIQIRRTLSTQNIGGNDIALMILKMQRGSK